MSAQQADGLARAEPVEHPTPLARAVEQPGIAEELQMARDARLALTEDLRQFGDGQLPAGAQHEKAQPRRLRRRAQRAKQLAHRPRGTRLASHT